MVVRPDINQFFQGFQQGRQIRQQNRLAQLGGSLQSPQNSPAANALFQLGDIGGGAQLQQRQQALDAKGREQRSEQFKSRAGALLAFADDQPKFEQAKQQLAQEFPEVGRQIQGATFEMREPLLAELTGTTADVAKQQLGIGGGSQPLQEIFDPKSPTGTRFVTRAEAVGQPGKPPSGQSIEVGPDGSVSIVSGRGAGGVGPDGRIQPSRRPRAALENKAIAIRETSARLADIGRKFKPEFLQFATRLGLAFNDLKDRTNVQLTPEARQQLSDFAKFKKDALENMNLVLKELSGAAVSDQEFNRVSKSLPNPGTGIFDGDGPTVFKAKLDELVADTRRATIRYNIWLRSGIDGQPKGKPWDIMTLGQVDAAVAQRTEQLIAVARQGNPEISPEDLSAQVKQQLGAEFGLQ